MLNKIQIIGRLGQDPETRSTQNNTTVTNLSVATSERYKNKQGEQVENTEWHRVTAWDRLGEICRDYLKKGSLVYIEGKVQTRDYEDKDGVKRYVTEIIAREMKMLDSKGEAEKAKPEPIVDEDGGDDLPF